MKPTILLDVDGPLTTGMVDVACALLREEGLDAHPHLVTQWNICASFGAPPDVVHRVYAQLREPGVCAGFTPREGADELVKNLRGWARVVAVTAPLDGSPTWAQEREVWLTDYLDFHPDDVVSARDKTLVDGDTLVDDKYDNVLAWSRKWGREAVLWNAPYNVRESWQPRASDYFELLGLLARLKGNA